MNEELLKVLGKLEVIQRLKSEDFLENVVKNIVDDCIEVISDIMIENDICPVCGGELEEKQIREYAGECYGSPSYIITNQKVCKKCKEEFDF